MKTERSGDLVLAILFMRNGAVPQRVREIVCYALSDWSAREQVLLSVSLICEAQWRRRGANGKLSH